MQLKERLDLLNKKFGSVLGISEIELYSEQPSYGDFQFQLVGLSTSINNIEVVGSAADIEDYPLERAYFEMLERACIIKFEGSNSESPSPFYRKSRSSGVGIHQTFQQAKRSAVNELIERDRVIRSWYGDPLYPVSLKKLDFHLPLFFRQNYQGGIYQLIEESSLSSVHVVAFVMVSEKKELPTITGFGADEDLNVAIKKAYQEGVQRYGFTIEGLEIVNHLPFKPTSEFHLDYYNIPSNRVLISDWFEGKNFGLNYLIPKLKENIHFQISEITPDSLMGLCNIVKAESAQLYDLYFGKDFPYLEKNIPLNKRIHPIA